MKKSIISIIILILSHSCFSQNDERYLLDGLVMDSTGNHISDVGIYNDSGVLRFVTDQNGMFNFSVKQKEKLHFSHVSLQELALDINIKKIKPTDDGRYQIVVVMKKKINILPEVTITENAPQLAYENENIYVIDYKLCRDGIFMIAHNGVKSTLLHLDFEQDTISKTRIGTDFDRLYRDAFGNLHLLSNDSVYQIFCDGENMHLLYGNSNKTFRETLMPVVASTDSIIVRENRFYHGQEIVYEAINRNNKRKHLLCDISGPTTNMAKNWNLDNHRLALANNAEMSQLFYNPRDNMQNDRTEFEEVIQKRLMLKPVYSPLYCIGNELYVFDLLNNYLFKFDDMGNFVQKIPIAFHLKTAYARNIVTGNTWDKNIIIDRSNGKCYAQFIDNSKVTLKEVNLNTGETEKSYTLDKHYFPQNIQIYEGYVYYLFLDARSQNGDRRSLYKMKLME